MKHNTITCFYENLKLIVSIVHVFSFSDDLKSLFYSDLQVFWPSIYDNWISLHSVSFG